MSKTTKSAADLTEEAKEARRAYYRNYYAKNREKLNEYRREWSKKNPDKVKAAFNRYWKKKSAGDPRSAADLTTSASPEG